MVIKTCAILCFSVAGSLLTACGGSSDSASTSTPEGDGDPLNTAGTMFNGTWMQSCRAADPGEADTLYTVSTITVSGGSASTRTLYYTDPDCQTPDIPTEYLMTRSLAYPGGTTTTPQGLATHVDTQLESVLVDGQPPGAEFQSFLDSSDSYSVEYDLGLVAGGTLYFGSEDDELLDGSSAAKRPVTIDTVDTYLLQ